MNNRWYIPGDLRPALSRTRRPDICVKLAYRQAKGDSAVCWIDATCPLLRWFLFITMVSEHLTRWFLSDIIFFFFFLKKVLQERVPSGPLYLWRTSPARNTNSLNSLPRCLLGTAVSSGPGSCLVTTVHFTVGSFLPYKLFPSKPKEGGTVAACTLVATANGSFSSITLSKRTAPSHG